MWARREKLLTQEETRGLEDFADQIREKTIYTIGHLGIGHVGGSLSIADLLALLYGKEMHVDPKNPHMEGRDLLVLSKGHSGPALYSALALKGFFPMSWLDTLNQGGTNLPSHCDRTRTPGIDMTTGSLGQGLSVACGMAYACRLDGWKNHVYAVIGDGESDEGQNWEAGIFACQFKLDNLIAFTDYNKWQLDGTNDEIMSLGDIEGKWRTFGWDVERVDGHDINALYQAVEHAKKKAGKPHMIIMDTIKGYQAAFTQGVFNHHMPVTKQEMEETIAYIEKRRKAR